MEFIHRKIVLTKYLQTVDTNGDGLDDTIFYGTNDKILQIPIIQKMDDMGIYNIYEDVEVEIIDVKPIWITIDTTNNLIEVEECRNTKPNVIISNWSGDTYEEVITIVESELPTQDNG
jgi:hypothetical protein